MSKVFASFCRLGLLLLYSATRNGERRFSYWIYRTSQAKGTWEPDEETEAGNKETLLSAFIDHPRKNRVENKSRD